MTLEQENKNLRAENAKLRALLSLVAKHTAAMGDLLKIAEERK